MTKYFDFLMALVLLALVFGTTALMPTDAEASYSFGAPRLM